MMSFGVMGGTMQPQGHLQVVVRIADYGQNPQAACDGPRFRWVQGMQVSVEGGFPPATVDELRRRGHDIVTVDDYNRSAAARRSGDCRTGISRQATRAATGKPPVSSVDGGNLGERPHPTRQAS